MAAIDNAYNAFVDFAEFDGKVDTVKNGRWYYRRELIAIIINSHSVYFDSIKKFAEIAFDRKLDNTSVFICINAKDYKKSLLDRVNRILPAKYGRYCECMSSFNGKVSKGVFIKDENTNTVCRRVIATENIGAYIGFTSPNFVDLLNRIKTIMECKK